MRWWLFPAAFKLEVDTCTRGQFNPVILGCNSTRNLLEYRKYVRLLHDVERAERRAFIGETIICQKALWP